MSKTPTKGSSRRGKVLSTIFEGGTGSARSSSLSWAAFKETQLLGLRQLPPRTDASGVRGSCDSTTALEEDLPFCFKLDPESQLSHNKSNQTQNSQEHIETRLFRFESLPKETQGFIEQLCKPDTAEHSRIIFLGEHDSDGNPTSRIIRGSLHRLDWTTDPLSMGDSESFDVTATVHIRTDGTQYHKTVPQGGICFPNGTQGKGKEKAEEEQGDDIGVGSSQGPIYDVNDPRFAVSNEAMASYELGAVEKDPMRRSIGNGSRLAGEDPSELEKKQNFDEWERFR